MPGMFKNATPIQVSRSRRTDRARGVTTAKAGKIIPLRFIPLLREDRLIDCEVNLTVELAETVRPLVNAVYCTYEAWFVPFAAFNRFAGLDDYNRSYAKIPNPLNNQVQPFMQTAAFAVNDIWKKLGVHHIPGTQINTAPIEAYNELVNWMYSDRSPNLPQRTPLDASLATCFWEANRFAAVVPNYDRSLVDAVVPLSAPAGIPVKGLGLNDQGGAVSTAPRSIRESGATGFRQIARSVQSNEASNQFVMEMGANNYPLIRAMIDGAAVHVSLANIDLARKTAAFDVLRKKYAGHSDAEIIELLMEGIRVPEYMERQPMLLAAQKTAFDFATRFATDGSNLQKSVTNGLSSVQMRLSMPTTNTGGIVMIVASVVPDQMFERRRDNFLACVDQDLWPKFERDTLDVDKVDQVLNGDVDTSHATPSAIFGYQPMNNAWNRDFVRLGGDVYRPSASTPWDEDRAMLWVTEPVNPTLTAEFYLATAVNSDPFADRVRDHLTFTVIHDGVIEGNTVFGQPLLEVI